MIILFTGSTGFVGQNLISYLSGRGENDLYLSRQELASGDYNKITKARVVVHMAGKAHDLKNSSDPEEYYRVNFELTKNLYDAFLKSNADKFIFISSVKASADYTDIPLQEKHKPDPQSSYGKSKLMAEEYIKSRPVPDGKSYYILRPCMIHGPGNKGNLNLLYQLVSKGFPYPLAAFENKRSFLSIENLCFVISEIIQRDNIESGIYHIADDEPLSTNDLVRIIALASGKKPHLWRINSGMIRTLAKLGDILKLPLTTERLTKLTESYTVDNNRIRRALGKELPIRAREGIEHTIRSFLS